MLYPRITARERALGAPQCNIMRGAGDMQFSHTGMAELEKRVSGALQRIHARQLTESDTSDERIEE